MFYEIGLLMQLLTLPDVKCPLQPAQENERQVAALAIRDRRNADCLWNLFRCITGLFGQVIFAS